MNPLTVHFSSYYKDKNTGRYRRITQSWQNIPTYNGLTVFQYFANTVAQMNPDKYNSDKETMLYDVNTNTATFTHISGDLKTVKTISQKI